MLGRAHVAFLLLLLMAGTAFAREISSSAVEYGGLDAEFGPAHAAPATWGAEVNVSAEVSPRGPMRLLLAEQAEAGKLRILREIGVVNSTSTVQFQVHAEYAGRSFDSRRYVLLGEALDANGMGSGAFVGSEFSVGLDWSSYEQKARGEIAEASLVALPMLGAAIALVLVALFELAYASNSGLPGKGREYTTASLFFPYVGRRPLPEVLADIFISPVFIVFELACVAVFGAMLAEHAAITYGAALGPQIALLAGAGALAVPLGYMALAWLANVHGRSPLRFVLAAFVWGALSALIAFMGNWLLAGELGLRLHADNAAMASLALLGAVMIAPVMEETVKALGVLVLSWHHQFRRVSDGLLYGFAVGVGFSFVENWVYFSERANPFELGFGGWMDFIIYRVLFNSLAHGAFPAACGALIGYFKSRPHLERYASAAVLPGLFIAIALHALFNISAILDEVAVYAVRVPVFIFNPAMVAVLAAALLFVFYFASNGGHRHHR